VDAERRKQLARVAAPLAFLLAATIFVLIVRSATHTSPAAETATTATTKKPARKKPRRPVVVPVGGSTRPAATTVAPVGKTYTVESGDTLDSIATAEGTTVEDILTLNPGVDPTNLQIGDKIRIP
jgi:LysM repeat protein